jgi:hypothetical protein
MREYAEVNRMIKRTFLLVAITIIAFILKSAQASVVDSSAAGFTIKHSFQTDKSPDVVYQAFASRVSQWWNPEHTYSAKSENLAIELKPGGCFCERIGTQGAIAHMTVLYADPGKILRMTGGLGPLQQYAVTGVMTMEFGGDAKGTKVQFTYTVGGYVPGGLEKLAPLVDQVMVEQMSRFERFVKTGKP